MKEKLRTLAMLGLALVVLVHLVVELSTPTPALDAKVGSDSATVAVATSADGMNVYVCDGKRCYASHDAGVTFVRLKVD